MKKYIAFLLICILTLTPLVNAEGVFAVTYSTAEYDDIISTMINSADTYEENFNNVQEQQGIYTQIYQARQIFGYATCVYGAAYSARKDATYRELMGGTLGAMALSLSDMIVSYNSSYFVNPGEYKGEEFSQKGTKTIDLEKLESAVDKDITSECQDVEAWCIAIAKTYLVATVEEYAASVDLDNEDLKEENSSLCSELYKSLEYGLTCISDVESVLGQSKSGKVLSLKSYTFTKSTVEERIKKDIEKYEELFTLGRTNVAIDEETENVIAIDPTKSILENMADVEMSEDGVISIEEDPKLSLAYFGILASGATYTPFESYVGDARFMEALDSLCQDEETVSLLNSYYNSLKLYKKPLYYRPLNSVGNPEGQAELLSISEIFDLIRSGAAGSLCTMNGTLCVNSSTGDWVYTTEQVDSSLLYSLKSAMPTAAQPDPDDGATLGTFTSGSGSSTAIVNDVSKALYKALKDKGMSDEGICGILGNIQQESGFNLTAGNGKYHGLAQWGDSFKGFDKDWDADKQIEYLVQTLYDGGYTDVKDELQSISSVEEACDIFCAKYERCVTDKKESPNKEYDGKWYQDLETREEYAQAFYEALDELKSTTTASLGSKLIGALQTLGIIDTVYAMNVENATDPDDIDLDNENQTLPEFDNSGASGSNGGQTYSSADKVLTNFADQLIDFKDAISAARVISDESRMNGPALLFGSVYQRDIDNMTTAIYSNVLEGAGDYNIENMDSEFLYINAFGDIVTESDLVVFPGILNPMLYANGVSYNPYTVAFMNSYPSNIRNSAYYMLSSKSDVGKYCLFLDTVEAYEATAIAGFNENEDDNFVLGEGDYEFALLNSTTGVKSTQTLLSKQIYNKFIFGDFEKANTFRLQKYLFCYNMNTKSGLTSYIPMIPSAGIYADSKQVFPYDLTADTDGKVSKVIANNMYQYLTTDFVTKEIGNCGKLWDNWILHYILISGAEGTSDISSYKNNLDVSYDGYTKSNTSRVINQIISFSEKLTQSLKDANGILGLQNSYEDVLLGKIVTLIRNYWLIFYIVFLFVVLIAVMKARKDLLQSAFLVVACSVAAYAFVYFVPVYLPMFYNSAVNNMSDRVAYEVMIHNNEYNEGTADNIVDVDTEGKLKYNTSSITLYRIPSAQLEQYYESLAAQLEDTTGGNSYVLDQYGGLFLEGDSLKMSSDVLFGTLKIKEDPATGKLHAYKTASNNVDYYIPYYQMVDNIVDRLNRIASVYDVGHSTTKLKNGARADNFRAYTYFNSPVFINPENLQEKLDMDMTGWNEKEILEYADTQARLNDALMAEFGENADWLGLYDILVTDALKSGSNLQNTLWFKTMCDVGYYRQTASGWEINEDNINALIWYVNYQARNFVYDIRDYIGDVSDETIVEIVALRAVVALTQEASDFTHWMYPFSMNYAEFTLGDVIVSTFVENYSDYAKSDYSVVKYVVEKYGWFNAIVFDVMNILMFVIAWLVKILSAAFYVLLMLILLIRMFGDGRYSVVVKGFLKCSAVIMIILLLQVGAIAIGSKLVGKVVGIYAVLGVNVLSVYLLVILITSILFNFTEFGNTALNAKLTDVANTMQKFKNISVNTTMLRRSIPSRNPALAMPMDRTTKYDFDADIDEQYDAQITEPVQEETVEEDELEFDTEDEVDTTEYEF